MFLLLCAIDSFLIAAAKKSFCLYSCGTKATKFTVFHCQQVYGRFIVCALSLPFIVVILTKTSAEKCLLQNGVLLSLNFPIIFITFVYIYIFIYLIYAYTYICMYILWVYTFVLYNLYNIFWFISFSLKLLFYLVQNAKYDQAVPSSFIFFFF